MADNTRSHDLRRMKESIWEILNKLNLQENHINGMETNITTLGVQQGQLMAQLDMTILDTT